MNHKIMLNSNLLRNDRWEWLPTKFGKPTEISNDLTNRLREVISPYVTRFYQNRVTRSLFTNSRKKQIAFIISQICLIFCIFILLVNIPPILQQISTAEDIFVLGTKIVGLVLYIVVLGFLFFMLIIMWHSIYTKYKEDHPNIEKYLLSYEDCEKLKNKFDIKIWIESDEEAKLSRLEELIDFDKSTLIICNSLRLGNSLAEKYQIPFLNAMTSREQLNLFSRVTENKVVIASKDVTLSVKDYQVIIDINDLLASRPQRTQRIIRLLALQENAIFHMIMTEIEYEQHKKTFYDIYAKGLKINFAVNPNLKHYQYYWIKLDSKSLNTQFPIKNEEKDNEQENTTS